MSTELLPPEAEEVVRWARHLEVGAAHVLSVSARRGEAADGEPLIVFDVTLAGPELDEETWPVEDVLALHEQIDDHARRSQLLERWTVRLIPDCDVEPERDPDE